MEWHRQEYRVSDVATDLDVDAVARLLGSTYWGATRTRETILAAIQASLCFGLYSEHEQCGFARIVGDGVVASWLSDMVVDERLRRQGLGTWLLQCVFEHPKVSGTTIYLRTTFAQSLYARLGFEETICMRRQSR
jgi:GNAT superfamily N-acetyltransferase